MPGASDQRISVRYLDDTLVLSKTHAWTYVRLPNERYEFLDAESRIDIAHRIWLALAGLVSDSDPVDCQLIITQRPNDVTTWASNLKAITLRWDPAPGWANYLSGMARYVDQNAYLNKEVYLGICLGPRNLNSKGTGAFSWDEFIAPVTKLIKWGESALELEDENIHPDELTKFGEKANEIRRSLYTSHVKAEPATAADVAWLIRKAVYPDMEVPEPVDTGTTVWGSGELESLAEGVIVNERRHLEIEQTTYTGDPISGFTATVCFSRFPDVMSFPDSEPWLHYTSVLAYPVEMLSRFTIVPAAKVQKDVRRKLDEARDQAQHIAETGAAPPLEVQEQFHRAKALEFTLSRDRQPWIYGRHRIRVTAPTLESLRERTKKVIEHYRDLNIEVQWPSGDQLPLLLEGMPGDRTRTNAYYQRQELAVISGGMPTASGEVGDRINKDGQGWVGPYIGETTSRVRTPVHFSTHCAIAQNKPPGVAVIGQPGGGKSFLAFTLAYQAASQGVWTIYIDPKADAAPMGRLPGLKAPKVFDLRDGNDGMLDPWSMSESDAEAKLLALETVRLLFGGNLNGEQESALITAVEMVTLDRANQAPSLARVVEVLSADKHDVEAQRLGANLRTVMGLPFARLCFAAQGGSKIRPEDGLTVITLLGLELPSSDTQQVAYTWPNRLAVAVMYLLARYARRLMLSANKSHPKLIAIDEAWAITSTPQGASLVPETARMGRSHNTGLLLVSQNAGDLMNQSVTNSMSTVFAFRAEDDGEIADVLNLLHVENHSGNRRVIRDLYNGECLMRDADGRVARVQVSNWNRDLFTAFDTNPITRGKVKAEAEVA